LAKLKILLNQDEKGIMNSTNIPQDTDIIPEVKEYVSLLGEKRFSEALTSLEGLVCWGTHRAYIYLAMGDICCLQGKETPDYNDKARKHYDMAINLATIEQDNQVIAAAKSGLAWLAIREAQSAFDTLVEVDKWEELKERLPLCIEPVVLSPFASGPCECVPTGTTRKIGKYNIEWDCRRVSCTPP
jgi:hypothetical protein